ncbi:putative mitochondrial ATP-dependent helicase irc3 [Erysiphe neolycopersici]|uniref:Putative mitochondrial ATP-dependent helicase irc3 n=1 Tax=Erysiphe neolycopersici TaxID=212602 RepID=A0A420I0B7_9PEZI|nr:putative mitochondrial ATP-dependent helicase irc3 [Erysiphe neolycopersici]
MSRVLQRCVKRLQLWPEYFTSQRKFFSISIARGSFKLREYQEECVQSILSYISKGQKRLGISLATGAGKTVVFTQLIDRIESPEERRDQTLILAHRHELVEQAARHCSQVYPEKTVEIEMGSIHATGLADITVASIQSITSGSRISKFDPSRFKLVLVDEAHHIVASTYLKTLDYFGLSTLQKDSPILVGVSATMSRSDGLRLGKAIDHIAYHKDYVELIDEKWLSKLIFTTVRTEADISKVRHGVNGDFQAGELSRILNTDNINKVTVRSWLERCSNRKSTLVFCVDLQHVIGLTNTFREHGIDARFITGSTSKSERSERLDKFKNCEFPVLINCGVFTEGTDIPNIDCVLLARPTRSRNLLVQMIGRGMRLCPGKQNCHIIDMVANFERGVVTTPTLFGLDPSVLVEEADPEDLRKLKKKKEEEEEASQASELESNLTERNSMQTALFNTKITFTDYLSIHDLISDTSLENFIRKMSTLAWVSVGPDRYILSHMDGCYLCLELSPTDGNFIVKENIVLNSSENKLKFARPRILLTTPDFETALKGADTYAKSKYVMRFIQASAEWRKREATRGQIDFLNKFRTEDDKMSYTDLTMGKASDMITKLKHGARRNFKKIEMERRRRAKDIKEIQRILDEKVTVGSVKS